jgi:hypothetical protein
MKDLTQGSVTKHLLHMSAFLAASMLVQTLYCWLISADCLIEFYIGRNCSHDFQRVSGNRPHAAAAV